jgi:hypothetical protein
MNTHNLINSKQSQKFKPLRENLNLYRKTLRSHVLDVKTDLTNILPNIRGGDGHGENDLMAMLQAYTESPFYFDTSSEFLVDRNREIQAIRFLEENFLTESNIDIADYESANDETYIEDKMFPEGAPAHAECGNCDEWSYSSKHLQVLCKILDRCWYQSSISRDNIVPHLTNL